MSNVTLKQLRSFIALAQQRSFTKAAMHLNISQSALTLHIRDLETEIGVRLFDRSTRYVDLTSQGTRLLPVIFDAIDQLDHAIDDIRVSKSIDSGTVSIAAGGAIIKSLVAPAIAILRSKHPGLSVKVIEDSGPTTAVRLADGQADLAIAPVAQSHNLESQPLFKDRVGVLCHASHPLARQQRPIHWKDLSQHTLVILRTGKTIRTLLDAHRVALGSSKYEVSTISALLSLIEEDVGISVLSCLAAYPALRAGLVFRPVQAPSIYRELCVVYLRRHTLSPAAKALVRAIFDVLRDLKRMHQVKEFLQIAQFADWVNKR
jgi:LysR family carnitine catabolism transcriptional activator